MFPHMGNQPSSKVTRQTHVLGVIRITEGHVHVVGKKILKSVLMEMGNW